MTRNRLAISTLEPTRYEVGVFIGDAEPVALGYTARRSKQGLLAYLEKVSPLVTAAILEGRLTTEQVDNVPITYSADHGFDGGVVRLAFTGRTERDAAS